MLSLCASTYRVRVPRESKGAGFGQQEVSMKVTATAPELTTSIKPTVRSRFPMATENDDVGELPRSSWSAIRTKCQDLTVQWRYRC